MFSNLYLSSINAQSLCNLECNTQEIYNEQSSIEFIIYGTVLIVAGYLIADLFVEGVNANMTHSIFITMLVLLIILTLMTPRFAPIMRGTVYCPDSLTFESITFSNSELTKEDVRRFRRFVRKFGYDVIEGDQKLLQGDDLSLTDDVDSILKYELAIGSVDAT